ncbi:hypothetical protein ACFE04_009549 [Oxalis oulophora]
MARLDVVNNLTGLTEWYGKNKRLRNSVNLDIVGAFFESSKSKDREEMSEIIKMHSLIEKYQLKGQFRWIAAQSDRNRNGELYRCIVDTKAMNCGLPTFATNQGGPAEIIVDGVSGFHIDPNNGDKSSNKIADFLENCRENPQLWDKFSMEGMKRINECYTWKIYADRSLNMRCMNLAKSVPNANDEPPPPPPMPKLMAKTLSKPIYIIDVYVIVQTLFMIQCQKVAVSVTEVIWSLMVKLSKIQRLSECACEVSTGPDLADSSFLKEFIM